MRHRHGHRKLGRRSDHRLHMLRNLATQLFRHERLVTTLPRAKELRTYAEPLITKARLDTLAARRQVLRKITDRQVVRKLFSTLGPRYSERPGGYTRIIKLGPREGDKAETAIIELVDRPLDDQPAGKGGKKADKAGK